MSNPYESPGTDPAFSGGGGDRQIAEGKVKPMALTMMITMIIMMVLIVIGLIFNLFMAGAGAAAGEEGMGAMASGTQGIIQGVLGMIFGGVIIYGCLQMMKLESYGLGMAACILAMVPCLSPCCILGIPLGIWGLVVLNDPVVKASFR